MQTTMGTDESELATAAIPSLKASFKFVIPPASKAVMYASASALAFAFAAFHTLCVVVLELKLIRVNLSESPKRLTMAFAAVFASLSF